MFVFLFVWMCVFLCVCFWMSTLLMEDEGLGSFVASDQIWMPFETFWVICLINYYYYYYFLALNPNIWTLSSETILKCFQMSRSLKDWLKSASFLYTALIFRYTWLFNKVCDMRGREMENGRLEFVKQFKKKQNIFTADILRLGNWGGFSL